MDTNTSEQQPTPDHETPPVFHEVPDANFLMNFATNINKDKNTSLTGLRAYAQRIRASLDRTLRQRRSRGELAELTVEDIQDTFDLFPNPNSPMKVGGVKGGLTAKQKYAWERLVNDDTDK